MSKARQLADLGNVYDDGALSNRNLIINGAMAVDQRNSTVTDNGYTVDRFMLSSSGDGVVTGEQVSTSPSDFNNSLKITNTTADTSVAAAEFYDILYRVEGYSVAHLNWGTSDAKTVTLSFWVRSSSTGTFSVQFRNVNSDRTFVFDYTVDAADTWQKITKTISGDTTGTWNKTTSVGIDILFPLATGSNYTTSTTDAWQSGNYNASTNANTTWIGTANNTFYITGVQLEVGDTATPFEHRSYGDELKRCQRYYEVMKADVNIYGSVWSAELSASTNCWASWLFQTEKRAAPTFGLLNGTTWQKGGSTESTYTMPTGVNFNSNGYFYFSSTTASAGDPLLKADAEL